MNKIISLKNINKKYVKPKKITVLKNISVDFYTNKLYLIKGESGTGKTTLINIIGTLIQPDSGEIIIDKNNINDITNKQKTELRREKIGFIFQNFNLNPYMNAYENVMIPLLINKKVKKNQRSQKIIEVLEKLGIKSKQKNYPKELSGGEQQRVAIARALVNDPKIILADEPTGALDQKNEEKIFKYLQKISKEDKCIIVVSHSKGAEKYADEIYYIKNNRIVGKP